MSLTTAGRGVCSFAHPLNRQTFIEHVARARRGAVQKRDPGGRYLLTERLQRAEGIFK